MPPDAGASTVTGRASDGRTLVGETQTQVLEDAGSPATRPAGRARRHAHHRELRLRPRDHHHRPRATAAAVPDVGPRCARSEARLRVRHRYPSPGRQQRLRLRAGRGAHHPERLPGAVGDPRGAVRDGQRGWGPGDATRRWFGRLRALGDRMGRHGAAVAVRGRRRWHARGPSSRASSAPTSCSPRSGVSRPTSPADTDGQATTGDPASRRGASPARSDPGPRRRSPRGSRTRRPRA